MRRNMRWMVVRSCSASNMPICSTRARSPRPCRRSISVMSCAYRGRRYQPTVTTAATSSRSAAGSEAISSDHACSPKRSQTNALTLRNPIPLVRASVATLPCEYEKAGKSTRDVARLNGGRSSCSRDTVRLPSNSHAARGKAQRSRQRVVWEGSRGGGRGTQAGSGSRPEARSLEPEACSGRVGSVVVALASLLRRLFPFLLDGHGCGRAGLFELGLALGLLLVAAL